MLRETIHLQHRCESLAAFCSPFLAESDKEKKKRQKEIEIVRKSEWEKARTDETLS